MKRTDTMIAVGAAAAIVAVVILSIFIFSGQFFSARELIGENTDSGVESVDLNTRIYDGFYEDAYADQQSVILKIIPKEDTINDYFVSYRIDKQYGDGYSGEEEMAGVSPENPIEISASRMSDEWVDIFVTVRDSDGFVVWESENGYA